MALKFYAVKNGRKAGIYNSWAECKEQVHGYPGALYKSFLTLAEAKEYINGFDLSKNNDNDNLYHIYVDGSYVNNKYSWGFAVYLKGNLIYTKNGIGEDSDAAKLHNVAGEIEGTVQAIEWAKSQGISKITIHHDYLGISEWAEKRWKTNNQITKNYACYMEPNLNWVTFAKVTGHTGVEGNELADKLAKEALGIK